MTTATATPPIPRVHIGDKRTAGSLAALREDYDEAIRNADYCRDRLQRAVLKALDRGEHVSAVARQSGYTRQRLHQLVQR